MQIRAARVSDVEHIQAIEVAAGAAFADLGMDLVAGDEPASLEYLTDFVEGERCWVSVDASDRPVAYLISAIVDGLAHVEQVSVHPDHAGNRLGASLIEHAAEWARRRRLPAMTLTTYVDVPWNGPYYETLGFRFLAAEEETDGLRVIRREEIALGLDQWPRACMRREL